MNAFVIKNCRHVYFEEGELESPELSRKLGELASDGNETVRLHLEPAGDLALTAVAALGVLSRELASRGIAVDLAATPRVCDWLASVGLDQLFTRLEAAP
jgi:hypothetical protein